MLRNKEIRIAIFFQDGFKGKQLEILFLFLLFYRLAPYSDDRSPVNASFCCDLLLFVVGVELMADHMGPARHLSELMGD